jgi:DNA polymerase-3 subunit alpha
MNLELNDTEKVAAFVREIRRAGIALEAPDVNRSDAVFTVARDRADRPLAVRYALAAVRGLGSGAMAELVAERRQSGQFRDMPDLIERTQGKLTKKAYESLIDCGACDRFGHSRAALHAALDSLLKAAQSETKRKQSAQVSLFDAGLDAPTRQEVPELPEAPRLEVLAREYAVLDFYLSGHPLDQLQPVLRQAGAQTIATVLGADYSRREARIGALITSSQVRQTKAGETMAVLMISDPSGQHEAVVFPEAYQRFRQSLADGRAFVFSLGLGERDGMRQLFVREIEPLSLELTASDAA